MKAITEKLKSGGTVVYKLIDDNIPQILEDQNNMIMANNMLIGIAGKTEIF